MGSGLTIKTIIISAIGGQGGNLLAEWIFHAATAVGYRAQSMGMPGLAQRGGGRCANRGRIILEVTEQFRAGARTTSENRHHGRRFRIVHLQRPPTKLHPKTELVLGRCAAGAGDDGRP